MDIAQELGQSFPGVCDQLAKVFDSEFRECDHSFSVFALGADDPKPSVFGIHAEAEFMEPIFVDPEHFCDAGDGEDVADSSHGQAAI